MRIERIWSMPNRWTFTIPPIKKLLEEEMSMIEKWVDPFCGKSKLANVTNDINKDRKSLYNIDALEFLKSLQSNTFGGCLYDPPYSFRQVKECYNSMGIDKFDPTQTRSDYWSKCKNEIARILIPNGKVICFGWSSMGLGKNRGFSMTRILLVPHGGSKNDTICTVEIKKN